ncbi:unnamed protein product [Bursaphelenchus xylophilus]|uniref:(pine wood nematode) hypothetical protein n=1 Tax=Bursaphelenchus xylophilus TaxID=6326 RepID=A0A1I7RQ03_BURXY|nr:unnamed protein product [Bursaphelenchus xylophilus]CAG9096919.1 unnamed protein product [Bursaphelenchus xylophilus]
MTRLWLFFLLSIQYAFPIEVVYTKKGSSGFTKLDRRDNIALQMSCGYNKNIEKWRLAIEGGDLVNRGDVPYAVAITRETRHPAARCGAVVISKRHILTATHCFFNYFENKIPCEKRPTLLKDVDRLVIAFGGVCLRSDRNCDSRDMRLVAIKNVAYMPQFHNQNCTKGGDIAVVEVEEDFEFGAFLQPACLFTEKKNNLEKRLNKMKNVFSCGWGNDHGHSSARLQYIHSKYGTMKYGSDDVIYFVPKDTKNDRICSGDSGSGIFGYDGGIGRDVLLGVHSHGQGCDDPINPAENYYYVTSIIPHVKAICKLTGVCPPGVIP